MRQRTSVHALNRGIISRLGLARIDLNRTALSGETMTNWMPRVLGCMSLRPGLGHIGSVAGFAHMLPFVFSADDKALIEFSDSLLRVWVDDALVTRATVTAAVANGTFTTNLTSWTDADEAGATSAQVTGGYMSLIGTGANAAKRIQAVTVNQAGTEHALRIIIARGPVTLRVGSTSDGDEYVTETALGTGTHSLAFTPSGTFYISFSNVNIPAALVDSVAVESAGIMTLPTPWDEDDLVNIRTDQSADVIFIACDGFQQRKIERRGTHSWSIVLYQSDTGPFMVENISAITITPSALTGDITLTASASLFKSTNVGSLYRITSSGQTVTATITGQDQWTDPIRVTGVGGQRTFGIILSGVVDSTVTLQYSVESPGSWVDTGTSYTDIVSASFSDDLDNQLIYYRIGVKTGDYGSDTISAIINYSSGSITGVARVTAYTSATVVSAAVLTAMGAATGSSEWWESFWSDRRGWPSAVAFFEGRLWWFGKGWNWGSISDSYYDFDDFFEGDAGPIIRSIASGPIDKIHWALALERLIIGTPLTEFSIRSTSFDEPVTPSNFHIKPSSTQGSKSIVPAFLDDDGIFVNRNGRRVYQITFDATRNTYNSTDLTVAVPDLNDAGIVQIAVQRKPDTRIHCVRDDGTVAVMVIDLAENVAAWVEVETDGEIEDVSVLPSEEEDAVYYVVKRGHNRYLEKWAMESECQGGTLNKQADSFEVYDGAAATTIASSHFSHGEDVVVWADGVDLGEHTIQGSSLILETAAESVVFGLPYTAQFKSTKLGQTVTGSPLNLTKRISTVGLIMADAHSQGLRYGTDFDHLYGMPAYEDGKLVEDDKIWDEYDKPAIEIGGDWTTDSRLCLQAAAPRPVTVLAASITMTVSD